MSYQVPLTALDHDLKRYAFSLEHRSNQDLFAWSDVERFDIRGRRCLMDASHGNTVRGAWVEREGDLKAAEVQAKRA